MDSRISKATCGYKHSMPLALRTASVSKQTSLAIEMWRTSRKHIADNLGAPASKALWLFQNPERFDGLCLESAYWPVATAPGSVTASLYVIVAAPIAFSTFSRSLAGAHPKRRSLSAASRFLSAVSVCHLPWLRVGRV